MLPGLYHPGDCRQFRAASVPEAAYGLRDPAGPDCPDPHGLFPDAAAGGRALRKVRGLHRLPAQYCHVGSYLLPGPGRPGFYPGPVRGSLYRYPDLRGDLRHRQRPDRGTGEPHRGSLPL